MTTIPIRRVAANGDAPQSLITGIVQDRRGFLWIAGETGLTRYDGRNFVQFRPFPERPALENTVNALHSTPDGRLWIGTNAGLYYFDPRRARILAAFTETTTPISALADVRADDGKSYILFAASDTLYALHLASMRVTRRYPMPATITALKQQDALLLIGTERGLVECTLQGERIVQQKSALPSVSVSALYLRSDAGQKNNAHSQPLVATDWTVACGTSSGEVIVLSSECSILQRYTVGRHRVISLEEDANGVMWCGTAGSGVWTISAASSRGISRGISRGGTRTAPERIFPERNYDAALSGRFATALLRDRENILWFGTSDGGLYKADPHTHAFHFVNLDERQIPDAANLVVLAVYEDSKQNVWIGTQRGLLLHNPQRGTWERFRHNESDPHSISSDNISCVYEDSGGMVWVGTTAGGLNVFNRRTRRFRSYKHIPKDSTSLSSNNVSCIYEDVRGRLWVGTWINGLNLFDRARDVFVQYRSNPEKISTLSSNSISCIREDRKIADGTLWIGTYEDGLNAFHPTIQAFTRHLHAPDNPQSISSNAVSAIYELDDGTLWITTDAGLNKFNRQTQEFTRYGKTHGLPDEPLSGVLGDRHGNLWLTAGASLCRFFPRSGTTRVFTSDDGITATGIASDGSASIPADFLPVQFSSRAYYCTSQGRIYFGTSSGYMYFHPDSIRENSFIPPVVITALKKFNKPAQLPISITEAEAIELWYTDNFISFEFAALGFSFAHKNRFSYKLEGFDTDWIDAGSKNEAVYTNLDGGKYVFRVKACNSDGKWNEEGAAVRVIIHPPFWRTYWFYACAVMTALGGVWGAFRWRVRRLRKRTEELKRVVDDRTSQLQRSFQELAIEKERTEEHAREVQRLNDVLNEHNAELAAQTRAAQLEMLRYQLNPHFLFNALISVSDLITENPALAVRTMTKLMAYLRYALQPARLPTTPLAEELKALRSYLAIEQVRFEERLQVHFDIATETEQISVPSFLLQPVVENAIKYGMRTSPMPLRIWVNARVEATSERADGDQQNTISRLVVEIINSGTMHFADAAHKPEGTGTGLQNIRSRLQMLFPEAHEFSLFEKKGKVYVRIILKYHSHIA